jgi:hypothetical protein
MQERNRLTEAQHKLLEECENRVMECMGFNTREDLDITVPDTAPAGWSDFPALWSGYGPDQGGCFREDGIFMDYEDVNNGIRDKYYSLFRFIADQIEKNCEIKQHGFDSLSVYVDADYNDRTVAVILDVDHGKIIIFEKSKAWNFFWFNVVELATEIQNYIDTGTQIMKQKEI